METFFLYFSALETLFPPLLIMDLLQRLSFWQTARMITTEENEEAIKENQEDGENKKDTTKIITITEETFPQLLTINVSSHS